jgi:hypothetical protein
MIRDINSPTRYATTNVTVETFRLPNPTIAIVEYETTNSMIGAHKGKGVPIQSLSDQINHVPAHARAIPTDAARMKVFDIPLA